MYFLQEMTVFVKSIKGDELSHFKQQGYSGGRKYLG